MKKLYYSISEISELLNEEQYTLRYWEKEFDMLKPKKNSAGNRIYSHKDIELLQRIKKLIREDNLNTVEAYDILAQSVQKPGKAIAPIQNVPIDKTKQTTKPKPISKAEIINQDLAPIKREPFKNPIIEEIPAPVVKQEQDLDLSEIEVKEGDNFSLFGFDYDPKISIKKSELQKLYNALADCLEELKKN